MRLPFPVDHWQWLHKLARPEKLLLPRDPGDVGRFLGSLRANADGVGVGGSTGDEPDNDIVIARREIVTGSVAYGDIPVAGCIAERLNADGDVAVTGPIERERISADGDVEAAIDVIAERTSAVGCVQAAVNVLLEC